MTFNLTGQRFGRLIAVERVRSEPTIGLIWRCICDCGNVREYPARQLRYALQSCGCLMREAGRKNGLQNRTHGATGTSEYSIWKGMLQRCLSPTNRAYPGYGGRGICVCEEWQASFERFMLDMGPRPSALHSVDRIDNDGNYEPTNCRWATKSQQSNNTRSNVWVEAWGRRQTRTQWAREIGINPSTLKARLKRLPPEVALLGGAK